MKKVLIVTNIPNPYRIPLFNILSKRLKENDIQLKVIFGSAGYKRRKFTIDESEFKFDYQILKSIKFNFGNNEKTFFTYGGINRVIRNERPDKIIVSGFSIATLKIWWLSLFNKTNYIIWSGAIQSPGRNDSVWRKFQRRQMVKRASAFVSYGSKAKEYLIELGAESQKVFIGINTVDTEFFSEQTKKIRADLVRDEKKHLTYIGYVVPRKNVGLLIDIVEELTKSRNDFVLDIVGDGEEKKSLEKIVDEKKLNDVIKFHGFVQKNELPKYYAISDCFLFQTDFDIWGLVLVESMAAGVTSIASHNAGATFDLIIEGETGFASDYKERKKIIEKINFILDNTHITNQMGKNAHKFIAEKVTLEKSAEGFLNAILCE